MADEGGSGVTVSGVAEAGRAYDAVAGDAANMSDANARIAAAGESAARQRAPVRTGALAASIAARSTATTAELAIGVPYWPAQEFGTRYMAGRRFIRAGNDAMKAAAGPTYEARMAEIIRAHT